MENNMGHVIERIEELRSVDLFKAAEIDILYQVLKASRYARYRGNEVVVKKGNFGQQTFVILEGEVGVFYENERNPAMVLRAGSVFGEVGAISGTLDTAEVRALKDILILEFAGNTFLRLLKRSNELSFAFLKGLIHELRTADEKQ